MKTIGIIGGIGPEATIDYYRSLINLHREQHPDGPPPAIIINSVNMKRLLAYATEKRWPEMVEYLSAEVRRLADAGADFGLLAANTPHIIFDDLAPTAAIPLISIVEATRDHAQRLGLERVGLIGTRFTMQATFYPQTFARSQMRIFVPTEPDQDYIHEKYFGELVVGDFRDETRRRLTEIIQVMKERDGVQAVILGGTELPLILRGGEAAGVPLLDTTQIHVQAALARANSVSYAEPLP
jgi:aspartate racemase